MKDKKSTLFIWSQIPHVDKASAKPINLFCDETETTTRGVL